ncbi:ArsR/SmtB family transcription factor [Acidithiobacillus acidisediminis]|uniref:ArsR/SmtB family transcription factor n=1 Tax=Acidithiobacillus acidisediminis TaxID=2937799 RepID=UPI00200F7888|nr:metalloregulator ArsR/SmtB family transcription factor [Acidithiobacillus sp. S30A2]
MSLGTVRFALFAEVFAALSHPKRLEIIHLLGQAQHTAGELAALTELSKTNLSQHLNVLKARGLVHCEKCGTFCHYRLTSPKVLETCQLVRGLILEQMEITTQQRAELVRLPQKGSA